jgi:hypothetical protein
MVAILALVFIVAIVPIIHPLHFAHGDILIRGIFPTHGGTPGFHHDAFRDRRGNLLLRAYEIHLGVVAWELELNLAP